MFYKVAAVSEKRLRDVRNGSFCENVPRLTGNLLPLPQ